MLQKAVPIALLLVGAALFAGQATGGTAPDEYLVGYPPANERQAHTLIDLAGGDIQRSSSEIGFAVVRTDDPGTLRLLADQSPYIDYVETNDPTRLDAAQWNGGQWNAAQWNGAQWNGGQWNGGQWNGAQWNDADLAHVSEAQRAAAKWTKKIYESDSTNKMRWAGDATDPGLVWQWAPWATNGVKAWTAGHVGTGSATLCVLDSGVAWDHPDLAANYRSGWNAMVPTQSAYDDAGHGTHIASIAAASIRDAQGIAGVAKVGILNAKVLNAEGSGGEDDLAFGLVWCAQQGADVAVMALSVTEPGHPTLQRALAYAADRDVLLLASAGNTGGAVQFPAADPRVTGVSAVDGDLLLAEFSSRGSEVDLAAPGVHILGALPEGFAFGSGTSQAVGYAAGAAALVRDAAPGLSAAQARDALLGSAKDLGPAGRDTSFGAGLVDVKGAVTRALAG